MRAFVATILMFIALTGTIFAQARENPFGRGSSFEEEARSEGGRSKWTAAGLSLLLPGAGELYLGDRRGAQIFMAAEGALWCTFAGYTIHGGWREEEYHNYAAIHAGLHPDSKDEKFFEDVLMYPSRDSYNYWKHLIYRDQVPLYPETEEYFWEWESEDAQDIYGDIRSSSETSYRNAKIALGVAMINRLISVVHIMRFDPLAADLESAASPGLSGLRPTAFTATSSDGSLCPGIGLVKDF